MAPITIIFHVPKVCYVTFYNEFRVARGTGFPTSKHKTYDASHMGLKEKAEFLNLVCNSRGCVNDNIYLEDQLKAWKCKRI